MGPGPTGTGALGPAGGEQLCPVSVACGDLLGEGPSEARQQAAQPRVHPVDRSVTDEDMCGQASPGATGGLVVTTSLLFVYPAGPHMIPPQAQLTLGVPATPAGHRCGGEATSESGPSCHGEGVVASTCFTSQIYQDTRTKRLQIAVHSHYRSVPEVAGAPSVWA